MADGNVFWAVKFDYAGQPIWTVGRGPLTTSTGNKAGRTLYNQKHEAFEAASKYYGAKLVKVTRRPKAKPVSREVWEGSVVGEILRMGHAVNGSTGRDRHSFGAWLTRNDGKRVRVTLEVLP